jgi:predicted methyltransferase
VPLIARHYEKDMIKTRFSTALALSLCSACAASTPAPESAPPAAPETTVTVTKEAVAPEAPPQPTAEELAAEKQRAALQTERAQIEADHQAERSRLTPELKSAALSGVFDKSYSSTRTALTAALKSPHRKPGHAARDAQRHPRETLDFLGVKPTMSVLEYGPGEGWYTELLAPTLYKQGKLYATNGNPNGPAEQRSTLFAQRFKLFLESAPELYNKVETVTVDPAHPALPEGTQVDEVLVFRGLHGMVNAGTLNDWLEQFHKALKPKGVLGIEQHRAAADAVAVDSAKKGYLPEPWVIAQIEAAGFKLAGKSEINKNPKDTKDHPEGVWSLPPTYREGEQNKDKYTAIGESDRMTLKFVKVEKKPVAVAPASAPAAAP